MTKKKIRLDQRLTELGMFPSRERARAAVMEGRVYICGRRMQKPGAPVEPEIVPEVRGDSLRYVSRGGLKLEKALAVFPCPPEGAVCLDCGASTGGFTDVLLQNGARRVYAVDVGYGQLAWKLRTDPRVVNLERCNVRDLTRGQVPEPVDLAAADLAFISLRLALPAVRDLLREDGDVLCLIKPQFEAGREKVGKRGVVRDRDTHIAVLESLLAFFPGAGFTPMGLSYSPVRGPKGNIEFLAWLRRGIHPPPGEIHPAAVVEASHSAFEEKRNS